MISVISLYESTHDLSPTSEIKMKYNVTTMTPVDLPQTNNSEIKELKAKLDSMTHDIKTLTQLTNKRPRLEGPTNPINNRPITKAKRPSDGTKMDTTPPQKPVQHQTPELHRQASQTPQTHDLNRYTPQMGLASLQAPTGQFGPQSQQPQSQGFGSQQYPTQQGER